MSNRYTRPDYIRWHHQDEPDTEGEWALVVCGKGRTVCIRHDSEQPPGSCHVCLYLREWEDFPAFMRDVTRRYRDGRFVISPDHCFNYFKGIWIDNQREPASLTRAGLMAIYYLNADVNRHLRTINHGNVN